MTGLLAEAMVGACVASLIQVLISNLGYRIEVVAGLTASE